MERTQPSVAGVHPSSVQAVPDPGPAASVERSREALLAEVGEAPDLTFVRSIGNLGDELIYAGTRELLRGHVYREIGLDELSSSSGGTVLLSGGGAFCRTYNEFMPEALAVAELRFDRVIVMPSSFDVSSDRVRETLRRTGATVFAREEESYRRIAGACRARLAHDCAFFFDFSGRSETGTGTLNAFRTDRERAEGSVRPDDNDDISVTCESLDAWLDAIGRHARVRTDRAHVMIAAALMGKEVDYAPSNYFKVDALARTWLGGFPVRRLEQAPALSPAPAPARPAREPRVTAVVLGDQAIAAGLPARMLVLAQNPDAAARRALAALPADELRVTDRDLGPAGGRRLGAEFADTEYVLFLDDGAELAPGALERLAADLDAHPEAVGVTPLVLGPDGAVRHFGGWVEVSGESVAFGLDRGEAPTGPSGWLPRGAALIRNEALREVPLDAELGDHAGEDWCLRIERLRPGSLRRCREAVATYDPPELHHGASVFVQRAHAVRRLAAQARFYRKHGLLLESDRPGLVADSASTRLLMELVAARGTDWTLMEWMNGGLAPLQPAEPDPEEAGLLAWLHERNATLARVEQGGWWRLRLRLLPLLRAANRLRRR